MRRFALVVAALGLLFAPAASAQDIDELDEDVVLEAPFEPGIEAGKWEFSLLFGYVDLSHTLMQADGIVVDVEGANEAIFGDMELAGESSFHPQLRINRNFGQHLALVNTVGFAIGDFQQSVSNDQERWLDPLDAGNVLTDLELEKGSYFVWMHDHALTWYPRGQGRLQPYLVGGVGTQFYFVDSRYIDGMASGLTFSYGAGLRVVGDDLFSLQIEVRNYQTAIQYDVDPIFETRQNLDGNALIDFPVSRLVPGDTLTEEQVRAIADQLGLDVETTVTPEVDVDWLLPTPDPNDDPGRLIYQNSAVRIPQLYPGFEEQSYSNLLISVGFTASF